MAIIFISKLGEQINKQMSDKLRKKQSDKLKEKMKRRPFTEQMGSDRYIYSLLSKQKFIGSNERLLLLKDGDYLGYARNIPDTTLVPFESPEKIPKMKKKYLMDEIKTVSTELTILKVQFLEKTNESPWEFQCETKPTANDWKKVIINSANAFKIKRENKSMAVDVRSSERPVNESGYYGAQNLPVRGTLRQTGVTGVDEPLLPFRTTQQVEEENNYMDNNPYRGTGAYNSSNQPPPHRGTGVVTNPQHDFLHGSNLNIIEETGTQRSSKMPRESQMSQVPVQEGNFNNSSVNINVEDSSSSGKSGFRNTTGYSGLGNPNRFSNVLQGQQRNTINYSPQKEEMNLDQIMEGEEKNSKVDPSVRGSMYPPQRNTHVDLVNQRVSQFLPQQKRVSQEMLESPDYTRPESVLPRNSLAQRQSARRSLLSQQERIISKPSTAFFVGGESIEEEQIANENVDEPNKRDEQQELLAKNQYIHKKRMEETQKDQLQTNELKELLRVVASPEYTLEKLRSEWSYEFAKGENEYEIVEKFKIYVEILSRKIVDELGLEERKREHRPTKQTISSLQYEVEGIRLEFFLSELHEMSSFEDRSTIISNNSCKRAQQEFKNYNYVLQLTRNKGRVRVPLMMMVEYKGLMGYAKALLPQATDYSSIQSLQKELSLLENESRISNNIFEDTENARIVPIDLRYYEKLSRAENRSKKFDLCYLEDLQNYLPQDLYNYSKERPHNKLRAEFVQDQEYDQVLFNGNNMADVINRVKIPTDIRNSINVLVNVSKSIPERAQLLVNELESLDQTFTNSQELSDLAHLCGLNLRYLGLAMDYAKEEWLKALLNSEIIARCCKYFIKMDLQDSTLNIRQDSISALRQFQAQQVVSFLNRLFGNTSETVVLWKQLNRQSQAHFKCSIHKEQLNLGYFLQSLQKNCKFTLKGLFVGELPIFKTSTVFSAAHFGQFLTHSKVYDLTFTEYYSVIEARMKDVTYDSYQQLREILNLNRKNQLDGHFNFNNFNQRIIEFLSNWVSPEDSRFIYLSHQGHPMDALPSKLLYDTKLTEIKWCLKSKKEEQSEIIRDFIVEHITKWLGASHPILSEMYDIFARYYSGHKNEEKKAVNYCRNSLRNLEKLLGSEHIKLADSYYNFANTYLNYGKKGEALNWYKKSLNILTNNQSDDTEAQGEICLRIGQLYLASSMPKEALNAGIRAYERSEEYGNQDLFVDSCELMGRCFELLERWGEYVAFSYRLAVRVVDFQQQSTHLSRLCKVVLLPHLRQIAISNQEVASKFLSLLSSFESAKSPNIAYSFLKSKIEQGIFPQVFVQMLSNIEDILEDVDSNGILSRWKGFETHPSKNMLLKGNIHKTQGFEFVSILEAFNSYLGGHFIEGVFLENQ